VLDGEIHNFTVSYCISSHSCYQPDKPVLMRGYVCDSQFRYFNSATLTSTSSERQTLNLVNQIVATRTVLKTTFN